MIDTNNQDGGFFGTLSTKWGEKGARAAWCSAFASIVRVVPDADRADVRDYLDSYYGKLTALSLLKGQSVDSQVSFRQARFLKHFRAIQRMNQRADDNVSQ